MRWVTKATFMTKTRWNKLIFPLLLVVAWTCWSEHNVYAGSREYEVKAAFIYNFTQFIEWPKDALPAGDGPFVIAVIGPDPFEGALEKIFSGKNAAGRAIVTKHFESVEEIGPCQLLFVPAGMDGNARAIMDKVGKSPVLIVGEGESLLAVGGAVRLYLEDGRMRFQISSDALDAARLKASAKLMQLARPYKK
jgi:hypothetical protein